MEQGSLPPGGFVGLACRLGWRRRSGALRIESATAARQQPSVYLFVRGGDVVSIQSPDAQHRLGELLPVAARQAAPPAGMPLGRWCVTQRLASRDQVERALNEQARRRLDDLAQLGASTWTFDPAADPPAARLRTRPTSLLGWARDRLRARHDAGAAPALDHAQLSLRDRSLADPGALTLAERRLYRAMREPRSLAELAALSSRRDAVVWVWLLEHAGALEAEGLTPPVPDVVDAARALLGVGREADHGTVRRAFKRLVRELHPDRHSRATAAERRALTERLAAVNDAYRRLSQPRGT